MCQAPIATKIRFLGLPPECCTQFVAISHAHANLGFDLLGLCVLGATSAFNCYQKIGNYRVGTTTIYGTASIRQNKKCHTINEIKLATAWFIDLIKKLLMTSNFFFRQIIFFQPKNTRQSTILQPSH